MKIIPVAIAVVKVLNKVVKAIASMFGFKLPDLNWDSVSAGVGDVAGAVNDVGTGLGGATKKAKELKRQLAGFDELNNLTSPADTSGSGGSGGVGGAGGGGFELDLPEYDMLEGLNKTIDDLTKKVMDFFGLTEDAAGKLSWSFKDMNGWLQDAIIALGTFAAVKLALTVAEWIKKFHELSSSIDKIFGTKGLLNKAIGVVLTIGGIVIDFKAVKEIFDKGEIVPRNIVEMLGGSIATGFGLYKVTGNWKIGAAATIIMTAVNFVATSYAKADEWTPTVSKLFTDNLGFDSYDALKKEASMDVKIQIGFASAGVNLLNILTFGLVGEEKITAFLINLGDIFTKWIPTLLIIIGDAITKGIPSLLTSLGDVIVGGLTALGDFIIKDIPKWWNENIAPWFTKEKWQELIDKAINAVKDQLNDFKDNFKPIEEWYNNKIAPWFTREKWEEMVKKAIDKVKEKFNELKNNFKPIQEWYDDKVAPWFTKEKWEQLINKAIDKIKEKFNDLKNNFRPIQEWYDDKVSPWFTKEKWQELGNTARESLKNKLNEFIRFDFLRNWWNDKIKPWFTKEKWKQIANDAINGLKEAFSNMNLSFKLPHFSWTTQPIGGWIGNILSALNLPQEIPKLNVAWYAGGGFPPTGQFFMAREKRTRTCRTNRK